MGVSKATWVWLLLAVLNGLDSRVAGKPWYCHGLDCPYFSVLDSNDRYETRRYRHGSWVSTTIETYLFAVAGPIGFRRLFRYIDEGNELGLKIPMTSPVTIETAPSCGPFCKQNYTVSFYLPKEFQDNPPKPTDPNVHIQTKKAATVFVRSTGGYRMDDMSVANMVNTLAQDLDADGKSYDAEMFVFAGYDPPFRLKGRHNEVWLRSLEEEARVDAF
ncbi:hypothetical protein M9435_002976 [Picochlorum sp. BPE23]|nr:hypothetical protein M9435_002976 [Picochlorum sp. BPE23]